MSASQNPNPPRWSVIYEAMTGATSAHSDHHEDVPGANPDSVKAGHEPDRFDATGIVLVPILVVIVTGAVYVLVSLLFGHFKFGEPASSSNTNPQATVDSSKPFNERISTISSSDPNAKYQEPRLEYIPNLDLSRNGKTDDPVFLRSFPKAETGNTPIVTPQDYAPDRYVDPTTGTKLLAEHAYVNKEKGIARIPVSDAIKILAGKLPTAKKTVPNSSTTNNPKLSNGGHAVEAK